MRRDRDCISMFALCLLILATLFSLWCFAADSTVSTDLILKARLYARARISDYWVLDLSTRNVHVHRQPVNGEYARVTVHADKDRISISSEPTVELSLDEIFPPD